MVSYYVFQITRVWQYEGCLGGVEFSMMKSKTNIDRSFLDRDVITIYRFV